MQIKKIKPIGSTKVHLISPPLIHQCCYFTLQNRKLFVFIIIIYFANVKHRQQQVTDAIVFVL